MKYDNEMTIRYESLLEQSRKIEKEIAELKKQFLESNGGESDIHTITVKDNFREITLSKAEFEKKFGAEWVKENNILKLVAYNTIVISRKVIVKAI